ncbi:MAG: molybdenum cofactor guanylyltransferase [Deltaproteobacteria bacterium]|nr:molybdenum cofactor guanylyltransferase [Deltaproteobacteria bacterium]
MTAAKYLAILVGGRGTRMGHVSKGNLAVSASPGAESVLARMIRVGRDAGLAPWLVGDAEAYPWALAQDNVRHCLDAPDCEGPLAGLLAVLRASESPFVLVGCDMPFVTAEVLRRLAREHQDAPALAARGEAGWEPLCARYDPAKILTETESAVREGVRSFKRLLPRVGCVEWALSEHERLTLRDWDTPEDLTRDRPEHGDPAT